MQLSYYWINGAFVHKEAVRAERSATESKKKEYKSPRIGRSQRRKDKERERERERANKKT